MKMRQIVLLQANLKRTFFKQPHRLVILLTLFLFAWVASSCAVAPSTPIETASEPLDSVGTPAGTIVAGSSGNVIEEAVPESVGEVATAVNQAGIEIPITAYDLRLRTQSGNASEDDQQSGSEVEQTT